MKKYTISKLKIILLNDKRELKELKKELIEKINNEEESKEIINDLFLCEQMIEEKDRKIKALAEKEQIKETLKED